MTLSDKPVDPVTISFATVNGTAIVPSDYLATSGTLIFPVGVTSRTITVSVVGDKKREPNEFFFLNLSKLSGNALFDDSQGLGAILNDD